MLWRRGGLKNSWRVEVDNDLFSVVWVKRLAEGPAKQKFSTNFWERLRKGAFTGWIAIGVRASLTWTFQEITVRLFRGIKHNVGVSLYCMKIFQCEKMKQDLKFQNLLSNKNVLWISYNRLMMKISVKSRIENENTVRLCSINFYLKRLYCDFVLTDIPVALNSRFDKSFSFFFIISK